MNRCIQNGNIDRLALLIKLNKFLHRGLLTLCSRQHVWLTWCLVTRLLWLIGSVFFLRSLTTLVIINSSSKLLTTDRDLNLCLLALGHVFLLCCRSYTVCWSELLGNFLCELSINNLVVSFAFDQIGGHMTLCNFHLRVTLVVFWCISLSLYTGPTWLNVLLLRQHASLRLVNIIPNVVQALGDEVLRRIWSEGILILNRQITANRS